MQEHVYFIRYLFIGKKVYAVFGDPQGGSNVLMTHEECQERLGNLRDNNLPYEATERVLINWPDKTD